MKNILTCFFLCTSVYSYCCSCAGPYDFCSTISEEIHTQDYVIMAKKLRDVAHGMEMEVIKTYRNEFEIDKIMVWGDLGWLCREYTNGFPVGDTLFLNLFKLELENIQHPLEHVDDFELSFCGTHNVCVKDGQAIGYINDSDIQTIDVMTLDGYLSNEDCANLDTALPPTLEIPKLEVTVGPNPFFKDLKITANQQITSLEIYDVNGRLVFNDNESSFVYDLDTSNFHFSAGLYFLRIIGIDLEEKIIKIVKA